MAHTGVAGFEPTNDGVKVRCVTASPHPNVGAREVHPALDVRRRAVKKGACTYFAMLTHSKKENGVSEGTRTLGLQSHNLTR